MGCAATKPKPLFYDDQYSSLERSLGFSTISISEFAAKTKKEEIFSVVNFQDLCNTYQSHQFGISLRRADSYIFKMFNSRAISKDLEMKNVTILCLALLYSKGTLDEKKRVIWNFYQREDQKIYRADIKALIHELLTLAGIIVPALDKPSIYEKIKASNSVLIERLAKDLTDQIFKRDTDGLDYDEFYFDINRRSIYFLDSVAIRENLRLMNLGRLEEKE